ncbi:MAG: hypothetical protein GEU80_12800 [Dehalococcoidia bacterium]|nr:hypothetical protein [Dehalococcoidia bacterium]
MQLKGASALRTAIMGLIGILYAQVAAGAIVLVLKFATDGSVTALLFLLPAAGAMWIVTEALKETARGLRS